MEAAPRQWMRRATRPARKNFGHTRLPVAMVRVSTPAAATAAMLPGFKDALVAQRFRIQLRKSAKGGLNFGAGRWVWSAGPAGISRAAIDPRRRRCGDQAQSA